MHKVARYKALLDIATKLKNRGLHYSIQDKVRRLRAIHLEAQTLLVLRSR